MNGFPDPAYSALGVRLYRGDCRDVLPQLPVNSVDAVVTDPPYGLCFMAKHWDYDVPAADTWREVLRVLKPGGHLLTFAGTRTQHRMAVAVEDAGFEIRDMIAWVYGSGFPKSLDVGKAIDREAGAERVTKPVRPGVATAYHSNAGNHRPWFDDPDHRVAGDVAVTEAARQWDGWGTALKPSHEPLTWATKPLTIVPPDVLLVVEQLIGGSLCLSLSSVKCAETLLASSYLDCGEASVSAHLIAAVDRLHTSGELSEKMAMFRSPEAARTILNIVASWKTILAASSTGQSTFTTSTATKLTTALKTFWCSISPIMREDITPEGFQALGLPLIVNTAASGSNALSVNSKRGISAPELASSLQGLRFANSAAGSFTPVARAVDSALRSAITCLPESVSPALEPITVARKPLEGTVAANVQRWGTGGLNVDGCRVGTEETTTRHNSSSSSYMTGNIGAVQPKQPRYTTGSPAGRWPSNLIHDGSPEATAGFPETAPGKSGGLAGWQKGGYVGGEYKPIPRIGYNDLGGSAARYFYCAKASRAERGRDNKHATVKPLALMRYLCRLVTPPGGIVLDPFAGSGSTGLAADAEGLQFVGIEVEQEYFDIAAARPSQGGFNFEPAADEAAERDLEGLA